MRKSLVFVLAVAAGVMLAAIAEAHDRRTCASWNCFQSAPVGVPGPVWHGPPRVIAVPRVIHRRVIIREWTREYWVVRCYSNGFCERLH